MKNYIVAAVAAVLAVHSARAEDFDKPVQVIEDARVSPGWLGSAYDQADAAGRSHCVVSSPQISLDETIRIGLTFKLTAKGYLEVAFWASDWKLTKGKEYAVGVRADDGAMHETSGMAYGPTGMFIWFQDQAAVAQTLTTLSLSSTFTIYRGQKPLRTFTLKGSSKAIDWLMRCAGSSSGETFEPADPTPPAPKVNPKTPKVGA